MFFETIIVAARRMHWRKKEESKDATAVVQARNNEGICQGRNSKNTGEEYIQNISIQKKGRSW